MLRTQQAKTSEGASDKDDYGKAADLEALSGSSGPGVCVRCPGRSRLCASARESRAEAQKTLGALSEAVPVAGDGRVDSANAKLVGDIRGAVGVRVLQEENASCLDVNPNSVATDAVPVSNER